MLCRSEGSERLRLDRDSPGVRVRLANHGPELQLMHAELAINGMYLYRQSRFSIWMVDPKLTNPASSRVGPFIAINDDPARH